MSSLINDLESTTFAGRKFTRKRLQDIKTVVTRFSNLSRLELAKTICEHIQWVTAKGKYRVKLCLNALTEMEKVGIFRLPAKDNTRIRGPQKKIVWTEASDEQAPLHGLVNDFMPITLRVVTDEQQKKKWKEFVDRYHYLGYKHPIGQSLRYEIVGGKGELLGCLLFSYASQSLSCRDQWLGWDNKMRKKHLDHVLNNNRFLLLPWVNIKNLASKALSIATRQLADDWQKQHGYRPVLLETYVDPRFSGASYRAANWQHIGKTAGIKASAKVRAKSCKDVYVYPLSKDFKSVLLQSKKQAHNAQKQQIKAAPLIDLHVNDPFVRLWSNIIDTVASVANEQDKKWKKRHRIIDSFLLILFIFRLVFSQNNQGYGSTSAALWHQCQQLNIPLPQEKPVSTAALCKARKKIDEEVFKILNTEILNTYGTDQTKNDWKTHRLFAVDGSKINLPRELLKNASGYKLPNEAAHYPQGLLSCLYRLKPKLPVDFDLVSHGDERKLALGHFNALQTNDVVVYDRGYFSYQMLDAHLERQVHAVFRLKTKLYKNIDTFTESDESDKIVDILPSEQWRKELLKKYPTLTMKPLKLRLVKYKVAGIIYTLGTTLYDQECYRLEEFPDLYHSRWGVEELYKISKESIKVDEFHGKSERGVKQELFAHFVLITMTRFFSNHAEIGFNLENEAVDKKNKMVTNFKNSLLTVGRNIESLFFQHAQIIKNTVSQIINDISFCKQRLRPGRSYDRVSKKPIGKWQPEKGANTKAKQEMVVEAA